MNRLSALLLCAPLLASSTAWAMRAHDYLDEQRASVTLPGERSGTLTVQAPPPEATPATVDEQLLQPQPTPATAQALPTPASPVPEPSGVAMLVCGMVLLLLQPRDSEGIVKPAKQPSTTGLH